MAHSRATINVAICYNKCSKLQGGSMRKPIAAATKRRVRGSATGRPIMALLDLLGRRWSLRIVGGMRGRPLTSRALRAACDEASPTVLSARLSELRQAGLVELERASGY